jgi:mannose-6-phosphate isomerase-like protein (cupin superfamily)
MDMINGCTVIQPASIEGILTFGAGETAGAYAAMIGEIPAGSPAPALHEHPTTDEAFYVAEGEGSFQLEDEQVLVPAGGLVFVPRGTVHTAWNAGSEVLRGLIIISPGDVEHEFVEVEES